MAKSQDLDILESTAYRQRNGRSFCGPGQLSSHQQQLYSPQSVFLTSSEDSSFTFVLSDLPKSSANSTVIQNKPQQMQSYGNYPTGRHNSAAETNQSYYTTSDQSSRTLPQKYHPKVHLDFSTTAEPGLVNYTSTLESRKPQQHPHKLKGSNLHTNLIEFGSPPSSPLKSPTDNRQAYHYAVPGKYTCKILLWVFLVDELILPTM